MKIWALPLSTMELSPHSLTAPRLHPVKDKSLTRLILRHSEFSWIIWSKTTKIHLVLYLRKNAKRYSIGYFGENQLLPSSISFSLLTTAHPRALNDSRVRASSRFSSGFTLAMASSLWLRVSDTQPAK